MREVARSLKMIPTENLVLPEQKVRTLFSCTVMQIIDQSHFPLIVDKGKVAPFFQRACSNAATV